MIAANSEAMYILISQIAGKAAGTTTSASDRAHGKGLGCFHVRLDRDASTIAPSG
jgi:hypothetical protein